MKFISQTFSGLYSFVYPNTCPGCNRSLTKWEKNICNICLKNLPVIALSNENDSILQTRLMGRVYLTQAYSMMRFYKGSLSQKLIHSLKYRNKPLVGVELGKMFGEQLKPFLQIQENSILVPVPLHPHKYQIRAYNQSEKIAEGLSQTLNIPVVTDALERKGFHVSQTQKHKEARWLEIKNDFIAHKEKVNDRDIILVDDICTSGATIEACAKTMENMNVKSIKLLTLAVAGDHYQ
ncbi:MAG: hypothetical protein M9887_00365 [Chitinophagales bacterium]|nr:hypothetical protein [Chitinophagales bacterium]